MSSVDKNLNQHNTRYLGKSEEFKIALVVSEWNEEVTEALKEGAIRALTEYQVPEENITVHYVPGSYELILGSQWQAENEFIDAVISLGCVIQGETRHFDFICNAVANGIKDVALEFNKPVIFGVLTTDNLEQAKERAGGKHGNKGYEAGITALKMLGLRDSGK